MYCAYLVIPEEQAVVYGAMDYGQKNFPQESRCHQLLPEFLANSHLTRVSYQSRLSTNDNGDKEMKLGDVQRCPDIYFTAGETPDKSKLGDCMMKAARNLAEVGYGIPHEEKPLV